MNDIVESVLKTLSKSSHVVEIRGDCIFSEDASNSTDPLVAHERRVVRSHALHLYHLEKRVLHEVEVEDGRSVTMRPEDSEWTHLADFTSLDAALLCVNPVDEGRQFHLSCDGMWIASFDDRTIAMHVAESIV